MGIQCHAALFLPDLPVDTVKQDGTRVERMHVSVAIQALFGRGMKMEGEVAETIACCMAKHVANGVLLPAGQLHLEMWQQRAKHILLDAKAVHFPLQLTAKAIDMSHQGVEPLVGRHREAEVAGKCFHVDELRRQVGIEGKVQRMDDAVGSGQLDSLDAGLQVVRLHEVRSTVHMHHHASRERLLRQMKGIKVDVVQVHIEVGCRQLSVCDGSIDATLHAKQVVLTVHLDHCLAFIQATICLDVVQVPRSIAKMSDVCLGTKRSAWAQHICSSARELGVGRQHIKRVLGQEVVKLEAIDAGIALISHCVQVDITYDMGSASTLLQQGICRQLRCLTQLGVGMNGHLWEAHIVKAQITVDTAEVHRGDVPLQVCPDVGTVGEVLHRACRADVDDRWHHHIAGPQGEVIYIA